MIVYLLVHLPTEMSYVGSTEKTVEERFRQHWDKCGQSTTGLHEAMQASASKDDWLRVTLEEYDDLEAMLRGEVEWMLELETFRPKVGFNNQIPSERDIRVKLKNGGNITSKVRRKADMSEEELERYREAGRAGGAKANATVTSEQRASYGMKAAEASRARAAARSQADKERMKAEAKAKWEAWWSSLTEEQKEAQREAGRRGGLIGGKLGGRGNKKIRPARASLPKS